MLPSVEDLFRRSLRLHKDQSILDLQSDILSLLLGVDSVRRRYIRYQDLLKRAIRGLARKNAGHNRFIQAQERLRFMEDGEIAARSIENLMKSIGDGIAWRLLGYDRASLRLLAEHPPVATPQLDIGLKTEVGELLRVFIEEEHLGILNCITNVLRIGDITSIDPKSGDVKLLEVKTGSIADARTIRQTKYRTLVQDGLDSGALPLGGERVQRLLADQGLKTYLPSVERAMRDAEGKLAASRLFEDYLAVAVFALKDIIDKIPEDKWPNIWNPHLDRLRKVARRSSDIVLPRIDSVFATTHFLPNIAPIAIWPIDANTRFALMKGDLIFLSVFNLSGLARWLERRGWKVTILDIPPNMPELDDFYNISLMNVSSGQKSTNLGLTFLQVAATEFWMRESVEETIRVILKSTPTEKMRATGAGKYSIVDFPRSGKSRWD